MMWRWKAMVVQEICQQMTVDTSGADELEHLQGLQQAEESLQSTEAAEEAEVSLQLTEAAEGEESAQYTDTTCTGQQKQPSQPMSQPTCISKQDTSAVQQEQKQPSTVQKEQPSEPTSQPTCIPGQDTSPV